MSGLNFLSMVTLSLSAASLYAANADVAVLSALAGGVTYRQQASAPLAAAPFMKLREGDILDVPAGAEVRVVFLKAHRQENWAGPASFRLLADKSQALRGAPAAILDLPGAVPVSISGLSDLVRISRPGGVQVRGVPRPKPGYAEALERARQTYDELRRRMPEDDITPELFLFATAQEYLVEDEMRRTLREMERRRPGDPEIRALEPYVR